ncbi:uncharacterized protein N7496_003042 [Penicillium cataractarum]|uniref:MARVEL domain-containing protein n=1 Tax=Penicillium cataractarum TaxID=2100454 RepID=A0A9W9SNN0_9EURO|nr:uncharacterized protein N7496_003042 [Penicillium cataractarum]KAJ5380614.1 hypothetical protein N7496_003042 [Penicillium cataractarum]
MAVSNENATIGYALRALQAIFAIIVMGTDGYAIHMFRGHTVYEHFVFGNFYDYEGVPDGWSFLIFCAGWTVLIIIFHPIAVCFLDCLLIRYIRAAVEAVAVLSWLAGFIAVAVQISADTCANGKDSCGVLIAATVLGALEWLLFMVTAAQTVMLVVNSSHKPISTT